MRVFVTCRMPEEALSLIRREYEVQTNNDDQPMDRNSLLAGIEGADGLLCTITDRVDEDLLARASRLKIIANYGVGFDHIDLDAATRKNIRVTNTPGVLTNATADIAFALILATARRIVEGDKRTRTGEFRYWAPFLFLGQDVSGKTLGIVGMGRIGKAVARRALGFDMKILYTGTKRLELTEEKSLGIEYAPMETLLRESDFVSLHAPLRPQTYHLIGSREFALMKPTAYLINTARGPIVDEAALVDALMHRRIRGAGLDVYENEPNLHPGLADLENVVLLPHVGSATIETRTRMAFMVVESLLAGLKGERPMHCLNC